MKVLSVLGGGLGYQTWLCINSRGAADVLYVHHGVYPRIAHCHPAILATDNHVSFIEGVEQGMIICGVRWFVDYRPCIDVRNDQQLREILNARVN